VPEWYDVALFPDKEEDVVKTAVILGFTAFALMAGCKSQNSADTIHLKPKWQGAPYHIAFDTAPAKASAAGITIPDVKYTANPDMLENRAVLLVRFDAPDAAKDQTMMNQMVMGPVDIHGTEGALPPNYMNAADQGLATLLTANHVNGKVKVSVMLARSSINSTPGESEIEENRLSDWLATDLVFKNPHHGRKL
jgi:hypothetical protein